MALTAELKYRILLELQRSVSRTLELPRVLDELLNTQPGVHYLKKVTFHEVSGGHE